MSVSTPSYLTGLQLDGVSGETWVYEFFLFIASGDAGATVSLNPNGATSLLGIVEATSEGNLPLMADGTNSLTFASTYPLALVKAAGTVTFGGIAPHSLLPFFGAGTLQILSGSFMRAQKVS